MSKTLLTADLAITCAGEPLADPGVLFEDGAIRAVGRRGDFGVAPDAVTHHFPGATVLPGLIDAHVHLTFTPGETPLDTVRGDGIEAAAARAASNARTLLHSGVTTARDLGDSGGTVMRLRDAIAGGRSEGPRLLSAGAPLTVPGGHCWFLGGEVEDVRAIRRHIARAAEAGVDLVKVMGSGGQTTPGGASMYESQFTQAELSVIVGEAHERSLPVAVHAHNVDTIVASVTAGVDTVEHCTWLAGPGDYRPRETVATEMAKQGTAACPGSRLEYDGLASRAGEAQARKLIGRVRWLTEHGVQVIPGTDAGLSEFNETPVMLGRLRQWGYSSLTIIEMATKQAAAILGVAAGQLKAGKAADLLVVDGNPLEDIDALTRVRQVVAGGRPAIPM